MNSLMSYGSDDESNDSGSVKFPGIPGRQSVSKSYRRPAAHEDNYEEVGMDMSEGNQTQNETVINLQNDSDDSGASPSKAREEPRNNQNIRPDRPNNNPHTVRRNDHPPGSKRSSSFSREGDRRSRSKSPKSKKEEEDRRTSRQEGRSRDERSRDEDRTKRREERGSRDEDRNRNRSGRDPDDKGRERDRYRDDRRDDKRYGRDRRDRDRRRSRSRERRRSRSPRRSSRSPRRKSRSPRRSRSGSRDKGTKPFLSRREKADKRMDRLDKLGIQFKPDNYPASAIQEAEIKSVNGDRFFMPGITGRFREQIEKRKQLWQKAKEEDTVAAPTPGPSTSVPVGGGSAATKVYEATTFSDDKTSNKFKRLMGIKETNIETLPVKATDVLKKQQEMFSSMEAQYEVARTATHTMRGVGLGFGSFQR